jgi:putative nucleotidyltransferase with HDIG domain
MILSAVLEPTRQAAAQLLLDKSKSMSAAPPVALQILSLVRRPNYCAEHLIKLIQLDPELTAQLLRVVNTTRFGGRGVGSLTEAVMRLGTAQVTEVAMSLTVGRLLTMRKTAYVPDPNALWRHSIECALACRALSRYCSRLRCDADLIFTAGLLHDLGKIVINSAPGASLEQIALASEDEEISSADAELSVLGADHAEIGGLVLDRWNLPAEVAGAIRFHHAPEFDPTGLAVLVHVGNCCAHALADAVGWEEFMSRMQPFALDQLGLPAEQVVEAWGEVIEEMKTIERFIAPA